MPIDNFARTLALQGQRTSTDIPVTLSGRGGAAMIGVAGGGTVEDALATLRGYPTASALRNASTASFKDGDIVSTESTSNTLDTKGGGTWRWDAADTLTPDNTGTVLAPAGGSVGRWKRVFNGPVNAAWFGVSPLNSDNTRALQNAIDYLGANPATENGGVLIIPAGYYRFKFAAGTSGLTSISVPANNILIEGEGRATVLRTDLSGLPAGTQQPYFFTWSRPGNRGQGGGIRNLRFDGNSQLQWCVFLDSWRFWHMEDVGALDIYSGLLDACNNQTTYGENVHVNRVDYIPSSGTNSCLTQYGVRFRAGSAGSWTECSIRNALFVGCWDTGTVLDGCARFTVDQIATANNITSTNTIAGSKTGCLGSLLITNTVVRAETADSGHHVARNIYLESHTGSESVNTNRAVVIDTPAGQTGFNRYNRIENVDIDATLGKATCVINNTSGTFGLTASNTFIGNRRAYNTNQVLIGNNVVDTFVYLTPSNGNLFRITDLGARTFVNGVTEYSYLTGLYPDTTPGSGKMDVGFISRDINTGRVCLQDKDNVPVLLYGRPGVDEVSPYGAQRIRALGTPNAPTITRNATGSTTYSYYWVAVDKDGNRSPPSAAATITNGPASLAGSGGNVITGMPVDGAVTYDLLKGSTTTSIATGLISPYFFDQGGATSVYAPSSSSPPGTLVVDGHVTLSALAIPDIAAGAAAGTAPTVSIAGNDQQGVITIAVGTAPTTGILATITFGNAWSTAPLTPVIGPATANAGGSGVFVDPADVTTTTWRIRAGTTLAASTTYRFAYHVG